jgi:TolB protein
MGLSIKLITVLAIAAALIASTAGSLTAAQCEFSKIAFTSTRDNPTANPLLVGEIYLMDPDGGNPIRLTENTGGGSAFAALSPNGKAIVFDSNRLRLATEPLNTSDLFVMNLPFEVAEEIEGGQSDGTEQTLLTRGSSARWSPDSRMIVFHASASGTGQPIRLNDPGAPTTDSVIFVMNVDDGSPTKTNITNSSGKIDQDPDWSPNGQAIVFTRHDYKPNDPDKGAASAEIYVINADGTGDAQQLTSNGKEPRGPAWSPDGSHIAFLCRLGTNGTYEICVMNADGSDQTQLTFNAVLDATPSWSPDGLKIVFHRNVEKQGLQIWVMNAADGTGQTQLTKPPGINVFAAWGVARAHCPKDK